MLMCRLLDGTSLLVQKATTTPSISRVRVSNLSTERRKASHEEVDVGSRELRIVQKSSSFLFSLVFSFLIFSFLPNQICVLKHRTSYPDAIKAAFAFESPKWLNPSRWGNEMCINLNYANFACMERLHQRDMTKNTKKPEQKLLHTQNHINKSA